MRRRCGFLLIPTAPVKPWSEPGRRVAALPRPMPRVRLGSYRHLQQRSDPALVGQLAATSITSAAVGLNPRPRRGCIGKRSTSPTAVHPTRRTNGYVASTKPLTDPRAFSGRRTSLRALLPTDGRPFSRAEPVQSRCPRYSSPHGREDPRSRIFAPKHAYLWNMPGAVPRVFEPKLRATRAHCLDHRARPREIGDGASRRSLRRRSQRRRPCLNPAMEIRASRRAS